MCCALTRITIVVPEHICRSPRTRPYPGPCRPPAAFFACRSSADCITTTSGSDLRQRQDAVFERLMPTLDLALGLRMAGRATHVPHIALVQPFGQLRRDVGRAIVCDSGLSDLEAELQKLAMDARRAPERPAPCSRRRQSSTLERL